MPTISDKAERKLATALGGQGKATAREIVAAIENPTLASDIILNDDIDVVLGTGEDVLLRWSTGDASNHAFAIGLGDTSQALHVTDKAAVATDWNISAPTHPNLYLHSNTTPATDYLRLGNHTGTVADIDVVGGTTLQFQIAGTNEATLTASGIQLPSGNSLATDTIAETTGAAGVTIDGVLVKDTGVFNADLTLGSTNEINFQIGAVSLLALDDAAITANAGASSTAGKPCFIETQDGGAASADAVGLAGGSLTITAGLGTAGGAHTSNNPAGGASGCISLVVQAGGAAGAGGSGAAGTDGVIRLNGLVVSKQAAPATATTAATLTVAQLLNGIIEATPTAGATAYTLPTGTLLDAALHADVGADEGFAWSIINLGADADDIITVGAGTDHTVVGIMAVASAHSSTGLTYGSSARFFTRRTAANTFVTYRIA